jgi:uncharacterized Zn finger protein
MKWIKCPKCNNSGYTELIGRKYMFRCLSCGFIQFLSLLNKKDRSQKLKTL